MRPRGTASRISLPCDARLHNDLAISSPSHRRHGQDGVKQLLKLVGEAQRRLTNIDRHSSTSRRNSTSSSSSSRSRSSGVTERVTIQVSRSRAVSRVARDGVTEPRDTAIRVLRGVLGERGQEPLPSSSPGLRGWGRGRRRSPPASRRFLARARGPRLPRQPNRLRPPVPPRRARRRAGPPPALPERRGPYQLGADGPRGEIHTLNQPSGLGIHTVRSSSRRGSA
jgi:hypothetical protein